MKQNVITLIAAEAAPLDPSLIQQITALFKQKNAVIAKIDPLSEAFACDIVFNQLDIATAAAIAQDVIGAAPIDRVVQPMDLRRKKLLISDMDSTIIHQECIDELADFAGCRAHIAAITERAMNGELDFKEALRERVLLLAGLPESVLEEAYRERITLMGGAKALLSTMCAFGAKAVLVSGGFTFFTSRVARDAGFGENEANILEVHNGKLTGKVIEPILDKEAKRISLEKYKQQYQLLPEETLAVGDGANDLPMILAAGLGVAYHAKPTVRAQAKAQINHANLRALLYVQGYRDSEILESNI